MGGWRDEPKILTRGDGGMEGIPPRPGTAMHRMSVSPSHNMSPESETTSSLRVQESPYQSYKFDI